MFKLVVLFASVALAAAKPGYVGVAPVAPVAYSAAVPAVSSVSQYSSSVVHGSPVVSAPVYSSVVPAAYSAAVVPAVAPAVVPAYGLGLSQAPHSPAVVLDAVNGVPLDTPEVVAARAAHFQAKALTGHHLRKRSVAAVAPVAYSSYVSPVSSLAYSSPVVSPYSSVVSPYSSVVSPYSSAVSPYSAVVSPVAYSAVAPRAYSVHPW